MAGKGKKKGGSPGVLGDNRKARFLYFVEESLECGIALAGTEVKSIKTAHFNFTDAYVEIKDGQMWLRSLHINPYAFGNIHNHDPDRHRRLLAHRNEIRRLARKVAERGYTLIPLKFYLKNGRVKVEVGLCRGKKMADKRETIKNRDLQRDLDREYRVR